MLRRIFNSIINGLRWYARHYLAVFCTSVILLFAEVLSTYLPLNFHWRSNATDWLVSLLLLLTLLHCLLGFLLGIALMVKKRILRGFAYALTPIFFCFFTMFLCVVGFFAMSLSSEDNFIKNHNITLPTDIELLDPEKATPAWKSQKDDSENEIEKEIKNAINLFISHRIDDNFLITYIPSIIVLNFLAVFIDIS